MFSKNKKLILTSFIIIVCASILQSCSIHESERYGDTVIIEGREYPSSSFEQDVLRIKLSENLADSILYDETGVVDMASLTSDVLNDLVVSLGVKSMRRTFPPAGEFEPRTREAGLHLWYDIYFDPATGITKAGEEVCRVEGVDIIEYRPKTVRVGNPEAVVVDISALQKKEGNPAAVFNDPALSSQWHYYNDGSLDNSIAGSDINVYPVWRNFSTGRSDVIVAVVDGGVDYAHEDLADNMWRNPSQSGDRVYGWNFVNRGPLVTADDHGTHVAGTIAAVNNNGIGVCGIAGGNKAEGVSGVRIMSCQIFQGEDGASGAEAIKWAADHGAVIAQNSWGYKFESEADAKAFTTPKSDKDAMDYFTKNAGFDANGNQTGPMAGGIVIFAAGNDGWNVGYPGDYETCIAVGSIGADYQAAYYTNFGNWVDVAAPGGDAKKGRQVYSTLPGNQYGYMQGTSMACPHVSGIAALIISRNGGPGFTTTALRQRLESSVRDISAYNKNKYIGKGLVDTYKAVVGTNGEPPKQITDFSAEAVSNNIHFSLTVPEDPDDGKPNMIFVYYSGSPIDSDNYSSALFRTYMVGDMNPGDNLSDVLPDLEFSKQYYIAAIASDYGGNASPLSEVHSVITGENHAPEIYPLDGTSVQIKAWQTGIIPFLVSDPDGHDVDVTVYPEDSTLSISWKQDTVLLRIYGPACLPGTHNATVKVEDEYGMYDEVEIGYIVEPNREPVKNKDIDGIAFNSTTDPPVAIDLSSYFTDPDGETLSVYTEVSSFDVANLSVNNGNLIITPLKYGNMTATVIGIDALGASVSTTFGIVVRDGSQPIDIYPNPVIDTLYIRAGSDSMGYVHITSPMGDVVFDGEVSVSVFSPASIDLSSVPGGIYTVRVVCEGVEVKSNVVKL